MSRKATFKDVENAWTELRRYLPKEELALERWGNKVRVIRRDYSRPFGSNYYGFDAAYDMLWFAIEGLRLAGVERGIAT